MDGQDYASRLIASRASRSRSLSMIALRLSWLLRPLPNPSSTLARWRFRYILSGTSVSRFSSTWLDRRSISSLCSSSLRGRFGSWLLTPPAEYWDMWALTSHSSPPSGRA